MLDNCLQIQDEVNNYGDPPTLYNCVFYDETKTEEHCHPKYLLLSTENQRSDVDIEYCEGFIDSFRNTLELVASWPEDENEEHSNAKQQCDICASLPSPSSINSTLSYQNPYTQILSITEAFENFQFTLPILRTRFSTAEFPSGYSKSDLLRVRRRLGSVIIYHGGNYKQHTIENTGENFKGMRRFDVKSHSSLPQLLSKKKKHQLRPKVKVAEERHTTKVNKMENETRIIAAETRAQDSSRILVSAKEDVGAWKAVYHCTICGAPKQKHDCAYRRNLQRSVGTMTNPLPCDFSLKNEHISLPAGNNVFKADKINLSTFSIENKEAASCNSGSKNASPFAIDNSNTSWDSKTAENQDTKSCISERGTSGYLSARVRKSKVLRKKRTIAVSPTILSKHAFVYAAVPVSKSERSRLSLELFAQALKVPFLTDECALVLQEAQELNLWDQAVAELYAQVLTIIYCPLGDDILGGLEKFMLSRHNIAC